MSWCLSYKSISFVIMLSHNVSQHAGSILTSSQVYGWPLVLEPTMGSWGFFLDCGISKFSFMGQIAFILLSQSSSVCTYIVPVVVVHTAGGCIAVVQTVWSGITG